MELTRGTTGHQRRPTRLLREGLTFVVVLAVGLYVVALTTGNFDLAKVGVVVGVSGAIANLSVGFVARQLA